jgi:hypothetical protein
MTARKAKARLDLVLAFSRLQKRLADPAGADYGNEGEDADVLTADQMVHRIAVP